jgi:hypothetical protein
MLKSEHRRISIEAALDSMAGISHRLREQGTTQSVCGDAVALIAGDKGPTPLIELFNWSHAEANRKREWALLRDTLNETIRLCARIGRHCKKTHHQYDQAIEPFDNAAIADQLNALALRLASQTNPVL